MSVDAGSQSFAPAQGGAGCGENGGAVAGRSILVRLDVSLGLLVEMLAAALVAAEIAILFGGVISRYVFDRPLLWSDELASTLFLWLAMLGAVIALRRDEHMLMTACVAAFGTRMRTMADEFASAASLAFLLLIAWPAYQYAREQLPITTSALGITDAWRAAALPTGVALMIVFAVLRLARDRSIKSLSLSILPLGLVAALVTLFWLGEPVFAQLGNFNLLIFFVGVVAATVFAGEIGRAHV